MFYQVKNRLKKQVEPRYRKERVENATDCSDRKMKYGVQGLSD
jgi:hypothetical protein